ncbi:MAG TPA: NAD-dependent epimerase/dehydratase family protein [Halococcus sp.]|nr:NAD-dependent epimerase/dehydratase family protein [Halococcus sp.]
MTTVTVTGAAGYIGSCVVDQLQNAHPEWDVTALDNFYLGAVRQIGDTPVEHVDIRNRGRLEDALGGADIVMHLAALSGVPDCEEHRDLAYEVNVLGTENVAWFCRKHETGLIFPFSMATIGDPEEFPITVTHPRNPLNWYGRTKLLNERAIETLAEEAFPAHLFLKSNLYGEHEIDGKRVSKGTVTNFFLNRALAGETLTVYEPGTQSRNYIHVEDVARAYVKSAERMVEQLDAGETGTEKYELASDEDPSVMDIAELVARVAREERDIETDISLLENPRSGETLVDTFPVDTTRTREKLGWHVEHTLEDTIRERLHTA